MNGTDDRGGEGDGRSPVGSLPAAVVLDSLPQMVWIVDGFGGTLHFANCRFHDSLGIEADDGQKRIDRLHPDDREGVRNQFAFVRQHRRSSGGECRIRRHDGVYRWHALSLAPLIDEGDVSCLLVTAIDIEDAVAGRNKLAETSDLFTLAQEAAAAGTWTYDLQSKVVWLSDESARLHNLGDRDVLIHIEDWARGVDADDASRLIVEVDRAVRTRTVSSTEFRVATAEGGVRWISGIGRAYYEDNGDATRMIGLNFDITARKEAEARLVAAKSLAEKAQAEAERASMAKSEFLASMSHEIRTPLNSIIGYTDLMLDQGSHDADTRHKLEVIQGAGASLLTIVDDILDFSKIEAGQVSFESSVFSPRSLLSTVTSMLATQAQRKGLALVAEVAADVPAALLGDGDRLRQIVLNLANNAVKFTERGFVKLAVTARSPGRDGLVPLRVSVEDSGIGIAQEKQAQLFQRFSQVDGSITRRFGGTGLGLAICKSLVELMGGQIGAESVEGRGSTFWFEIALHAATALERKPTEDRSSWPAGAAAKILLVEDVAVNRDLAVAVLTSGGHEVDTAAHGGVAVAMVQSARYDLVLMDVQMPVMDGIAATREIRTLPGPVGRIPIIAMTANVLPQQIAALKDAGMDDHVCKPFKAPVLFATIARWMHRMEDEVPAPPPAEPSFDDAAFGALESMIGEAAFRSIVAKFVKELSARIVDVGAEADPQRIAADAHALIPSAGLLGFVRLTALCRSLEDPSADAPRRAAVLADFARERLTVLAHLRHGDPRTGPST